MAAARAAETLRSDRLLADPYAAALATLDPSLLPVQPLPDRRGQAPSEGAGSSASSTSTSSGGEDGVARPAAAAGVPSLLQSREAMLDVFATAHIDQALANALQATSTNRIQGGDYRQLVLLGDGMDTRPFRLPLPTGTVVFALAPPEVHERAEAVVGSGPTAPLRVPRGCLLRRAPLTPPGGDGGGAGGAGGRKGLGAVLADAGFRGDRLSVWALQGLHGLGLSPGELRELLADVANSTSYHSLVVGELPGVSTQREAENLLAECGLLGVVVPHGAEEAEGEGAAQAHPRWDAVAWGKPEGAGHGRWLFSAQQMRLSAAQMGILEDHAEAQVDEDFFGHFS